MRLSRRQQLFKLGRTALGRLVALLLRLEALVARLCEGEAAALDALMARHASALVAFCGYYLDAEAAQDAAQETFVRVLQRCGSMKQTMPFKPWLFAIARNVSVSMLRRQRLRAALSVEALQDERRMKRPSGGGQAHFSPYFSSFR
jgi:DNA-directed RNA polymerase specialized sigma24 family protein